MEKHYKIFMISYLLLGIQYLVYSQYTDTKIINMQAGVTNYSANLFAPSCNCPQVVVDWEIGNPPSNSSVSFASGPTTSVLANTINVVASAADEFTIVANVGYPNCSTCASHTETFLIKIFEPSPPSPPTLGTGMSSSMKSCGIVTLTANGSGTIKWYSDASLTQLIGTGSPLILDNLIQSSPYYVVSEENGLQSSPVSFTVIPIQGVQITDNQSNPRVLTVAPEQSGDNFSSYQWYKDNSPLTQGSSITITEEGTYKVIASITDSQGNPCTREAIINIAAPSSTPTLCNSTVIKSCGQNISLCATGNGIINWYADVNRTVFLGSSTSGADFLIRELYDDARFYAVSEVNGIESGDATTIPIEFYDGIEITRPTTTSLNVAPLRAGDNFTSYQWYYEGTAIGTGTSLNICANGRYKVVATVASNGGINCERVAIIDVNDLLLLDADFSYTICDRKVDVIVTNPFTDLFEYEWEFKEGENTTALTGITATYTYSDYESENEVKLIARFKSGLCNGESEIENTQLINTNKVLDIPNRTICIVPHTLDVGQGFTSYEWRNSGGQVVSTDQIYNVNASGTYTIKAILPDGCEINDDVIVTVITDLNTTTTNLDLQTYSLEKVLNASASTFSDQWLLDYSDLNITDMVELEGLMNKDSYQNGQSGIWRTKTQWNYEVDRQKTNNIDIRNDGIFEDFEMFNWEENGIYQMERWRNVNTMTRYNPSSYELENQDILDRNSSALYGYNNQLPIATGVNMAYEEMAYMGFEQEANGNFSFTEKTEGELTNDVFRIRRFEVIFGANNQIILNQPESELTQLIGRTDLYMSFDNATSNSEVTISPSLFKYRPRNKVYVDCLFDKGTFTLGVLSGSESLYTLGNWKGYLYFFEVIQADAVEFSEAAAHTGKKSLRLSANVNADITQELLKLKAGKKYIVSAWVKDASNISSITIEGKTMSPKSPSIEGWKRIQDSFTVGGDPPTITFNAGSQVTYFDDIRIYPETGNMQSYVYNPADYRLSAVLDNNNYATYYYYDPEGNLFLVKKETVEGIKTIQESMSYRPVR